MKKDESFKDHILDQLADLGGVLSRRMFGGWGFYKDGIIFALMYRSEVYFKVDGSNIEEYKERDSYPFTYKKKGDKDVSLSYWKLPEEILENKDELYEWVAKSVAASIKSKKKK